MHRIFKQGEKGIKGNFYTTIQNEYRCLKKVSSFFLYSIKRPLLPCYYILGMCTNVIHGRNGHYWVWVEDICILCNAILFQIFFLIARMGRLLVALATLFEEFTGAMAMAYLTSKWLNAVNQANFQRGTNIAMTRMYDGPLTRKESASVEMVTFWRESIDKGATVSTVSIGLNVARWTCRWGPILETLNCVE